MRNSLTLIAMTATLMLAGCQSSQKAGTGPGPDGVVKGRQVEAGCSLCIYDVESDQGCTLAIKMNDKVYLVTGTDMHDHGDAHADDGMCMVARQAVVDGKVEDGRFAATSFKLLPRK